jgi:parallel beta-helix repeat protein
MTVFIFDGVSNATAQNNVIGNNDFYGVLVVSTDPLASTSNVSVTGNFIGTNVDEDNTANGRSGIWVLGDARGHGTVDTVSITGNTIANNAVHGIEVWSATNVTLGGTRGESSENIISNNAQYGIAFTDVVTNSFVHGNTLLGNAQAGLYLNSAQGVTVGGGVDGKSSLDIQQSDFGVVAGGDLTGTNLVGNRVHENRQAGFQLLGARDFHLFRNTIENNGPYGVLAIGDSSNSRISGNTISRHGAGVWLAGASGMVIGSLAGVSNEQAVGNKIEDNSSVGIIIQGEDSFDNVILSNQIDANIYYGIQFIQGARTVSVPRLVSVTTEQITGRITGDDGEVYRIQFFYTPAAQAADGRTSQGEFLIGYEDVTIVDGAASISLDISSSDVVAGDIVTATATLMHNGTPSQSSSFSQGRRVREATV